MNFHQVLRDIARGSAVKIFGPEHGDDMDRMTDRRDSASQGKRRR